ncbi:hypothetical protein Tco_1337260 [Tanacetum coccineum]
MGVTLVFVEVKREGKVKEMMNSNLIFIIWGVDPCLTWVNGIEGLGFVGPGCQTHPCGWAVKPNAPFGGDGGMEEKDGDEEEMVVGATVVSGDGGVMMVRRLVVASRRERWRRGDEGGVATVEEGGVRGDRWPEIGRDLAGNVGWRRKIL